MIPQPMQPCEPVGGWWCGWCGCGGGSNASTLILPPIRCTVHGAGQLGDTIGKGGTIHVDTHTFRLRGVNA